MTNKEAIICLQGLLENPLINKGSYLAQAIEVAIQALSQEPTDDKCHYCEHTFTPYKGNTGEFTEQEPCDDSISREELLKAIDTWDKFGYTETGCFVRITKEIDNYVPYVHLEDVITAIQKLPSVTQKSGKWLVDLQTATEDYYICSECGRRIHLLYPDTISNYPYCHCGARMESEDKE